ncbi:MAG: DUF4340 domain-containing protein [Verrucomicrobiota bacterium]
MRLKITLTLLVIFLGLLVYIFYIDTSGPSHEDEQIADVIAPPDVSYIRFAKPGSSTGTTLEKQGQRWMLTEPFLWPANEYAVERILSQVRFLDIETSFEVDLLAQAKASLSDYGLAPADLNLEFGAGDERSVIGIGKATDIGDNLYILSVDRKYIHVVDRSLLDSLSINIEQIRDPRIFTSNVFEVTSWNLQRDEENTVRTRIARRGDGWNFETPIRARADTPSVNTLLNRILSLDTKSIVTNDADELSPYGLQTPELRIAIETEQTREVLEIGSPVPTQDGSPSIQRYAKREDRPTIFQIEVEFQDLLANAQTKLRDRHIFGIETAEATSVAIAQIDEEPLTLQKLETGDWEILLRDPERGIVSVPGDKPAIEELLALLDNLKAIPENGFINDAPSALDLETYALEAPRFTIGVTSRYPRDDKNALEVAQTETLMRGANNPAEALSRFVKIKNTPFVYSVYSDAFENIDNDPLLFRDRNLLSIPEDANISQILIERLADKAVILDTQDETTVNEHTPALIAQLANLRAERYLPEAFGSSVTIAQQQKPWAYLLTLSLNSESADHTHQIYLSEAQGPVLIGGMNEKANVFRLPQAFIDPFFETIFNRIRRPIPEQPFADDPLPEAE